jgi:hypothetical protein
MDAPKCRLCGEKHWGGCPSFTAPFREPDYQPVTAEPEPLIDVANIKRVANTYRYRDAEKRRAYMRELMRKRRKDA